MRETEKSLIDSIESAHIVSREDRQRVTLEIYSHLQEIPFGSMSEEFINHPTVKGLITPVEDDFLAVALRAAIEDYLLNKSRLEVSASKFEIVKMILLQCIYAGKFGRGLRAVGMARLPVGIVNIHFIRELYRINDEKLINLFMEYFPKPRSHVFTSTPVPSQIRQAEREVEETITPALARDLYEVEKQVKKVQRMWRAKQRKSKEFKRVMYYYSLKDGDETQGLLNEANMPYRPMTDIDLSNRIMKATENLQLFREVKHLTSENALESIMNNGLYGRKTLEDFYMDFKPAALAGYDIAQGDLNVVCMGAQFGHIDEASRHGITLRFDAKKISDNNPCVFFKQRDLGLNLTKIIPRVVYIGDLEISFSTTERYLTNTLDKKVEFLMFDPDQEEVAGRIPYASSSIINQLLISYNIEKMHQILTLNFFRFIDSMVALDPNTPHPMAKEIYAALGRLNDKDLLVALKDIGTKVSDCMEFNFYGAYQIDFSALESVTNDVSFAALYLNLFIKDTLNGGNHDRALSELSHYVKWFDGMFKSYRFIDYLLTQVTNAPVVAALQELRKKCVLPHYMKPN